MLLLFSGNKQSETRLHLLGSSELRTLLSVQTGTETRTGICSVCNFGIPIISRFSVLCELQADPAEAARIFTSLHLLCELADSAEISRRFSRLHLLTEMPESASATRILSRLSLLTEMPEEQAATRIFSRLSVLTTLRNEPIMVPLHLFTEIQEKYLLRSRLSLLNQIGEPASSVIFPAEDTEAIPAPETPEGLPPITGGYEIYIDGKPCKHRVTACSVTLDESYVHNTVSITSSDMDLFFECDPDVKPGEARIEIRVGSRIFLFTIDNRKASGENTFTLDGYSPGVRNNAEFSPGWSAPAMNGKMSASALASAMIEHGTVTWSTLDWVLPETADWPSDSIEAVQKIASAIGSIVRSADDGTLTVRRKWIARPCKITVGEIVYERTGVVEDSISAERVKGEGYTAVEISNVGTESLETPEIELEESGPTVGQTVHLRVYWKNGIQPENVEAFATAGEGVTFLGKHEIEFPVMEKEDDPYYERVEFKEGTGSVSKPITQILQKKWIGAVPGEGDVFFTPYSKDLTIDGMWAICDIRYKSEYHRYRVDTDSVEALIAVLGYSGTDPSGLCVYVRTAEDPPKEMDPISDVMISSESAAVERGTAEIDEKKYDRHKVSIRAPYHDRCSDGTIIEINVPRIEVIGAYKVQRVTITFDGPAIWNEIEAVKCLLIP